MLGSAGVARRRSAVVCSTWASGAQVQGRSWLWPISRKAQAMTLPYAAIAQWSPTAPEVDAGAWELLCRKLEQEPRIKKLPKGSPS